MSLTFSPRRVRTVPTPRARVASSAEATSSPGMKRETALRTKPSFGARSRSQRLSEPARRTLLMTPMRRSRSLLLAGDVPHRRELAVARTHFSDVRDLAVALLRKRVAELHLLSAHRTFTHPDDLAPVPPRRRPDGPASRGVHGQALPVVCRGVVGPVLVGGDRNRVLSGSLLAVAGDH